MHDNTQTTKCTMLKKCAFYWLSCMNLYMSYSYSRVSW